MGFVWQAHDQVLDREVAVKEVFVPDHNEDRSERAFREARAAGRLNHPGIVTIHDLVSDDGRSWIVMELVNAPSLEIALRESGPMPPGRVARIGLALLEALRAAHDAGILHRDIKPGNVLLPGDRAVITDFGIATIAGDDKLTATGHVVGTPAYMPTSAGLGPLTPVLEGLLRDDPGARLTAGEASAQRRPAGQSRPGPADVHALHRVRGRGVAQLAGHPGGIPRLHRSGSAFLGRYSRHLDRHRRERRTPALRSGRMPGSDLRAAGGHRRI
jgi:serine/threonine protein kinase